MEENQEKVVKTPKKGIRLWVFIVSLIATMLISVFITKQIINMHLVYLKRMKFFKLKKYFII